MCIMISLNGDDWIFKDFYGEDWIWRHSEKPDSKDVRWWRKGTVPGSVHHDLLQLGETPDPYFERNSLLAEWVSQRTWIYKKQFPVDEKYRGRRIQLCFKGIDYEASIFLNGEKVGYHKGMYTPVEFDVGSKLLYGENNLLAVVIERAPDGEPQVSKTRYVHTHKSRMTYWWDFCPRMIHIGIWDDVYLKITGPVKIDDIFVQPHVSNDHSEALISVSTRIHANRRMKAVLDITLYHEGNEVASVQSLHALNEGETSMNSRMTVDSPQLWWPNGAGKANLYTAKVKVIEKESGKSIDSDEMNVNFGIRQINVVANQTEDATALPYTFVVNGRKVYIKGWNWVPIDVMYGVNRPEKLNRLLTLAKRANVNMLRVWGGGLIEKDSFYELCNQFGIMVWQEFIQSSSGIENKPSEDPDFIELMIKEAEQIIPGKRNHPSLAVWCGGNELQDGEEAPLSNKEPVLGALANVVKRLDPDRYWLPTSPTGRCFSNSLNNIAKDPTGLHDVHGPWEHQGLTVQYTLYNQGSSLLHSEFGVEGMTNLKVIHHTISKQNQWPASKDNPVYFHRGSWWNNETFIQEAFGGIEDIETLQRASQFLQAEGLRYAVESNMRRQFQNSGTLPWQFNEPFPNAYCTSALDYYAEPKAVYYTVRRAYSPVHVTVRFASQVWEGQDHFEAEVWAVNSLTKKLDKLKVVMRIVGASGKIYAESSEFVHVAENNSSFLTDFKCSLTDVIEPLFFLDLRLGDDKESIVCANRYVFSKRSNLQPMLEIGPSILQTRVQKGENRWDMLITNSGRMAALYVRLEDGRELNTPGYVYFDDNYFTLLPGESKKICAEWCGAAEANRKIDLAGWNTDYHKIL